MVAELFGACAGVDVGGTFTDVVVHAAGHRPRAVKVPTTPGNQAVGVQRGVEQAWPGAALRLLPHGTTTATNAVLQRSLARTVLVTTDGFTDVLQIARQDRPALYDLTVTRPEPLVPCELVVTVIERTSPDGEAVIALTDEEIDRVVHQVQRLEPESIAVSLLFSYAGDEHERRLCDALSQARRADHPIQRAAGGVSRVRAGLDVRAQRRRRARDAPLPVQPDGPAARSDDHRDDLRWRHRRASISWPPPRCTRCCPGPPLVSSRRVPWRAAPASSMRSRSTWAARPPTCA